MTAWEHLLLALPAFGSPTNSAEPSAVIQAMNEQGALGWEAVGMTVLGEGTVAVLFKRPLHA